MLTIIYPLSFFACLSGLILWFYYQNDNDGKSRAMSKIFLVSFFIYLFSLAFSEGATSYKLMILFRDLLVIGLVGQFFNFFKRYKFLFFGLLVILYGATIFKYFAVWQSTFPQISPAELDKKGELLLEIKEKHGIKELGEITEQYGLTYERAFQLNRADQTDLDDYYIVNIPENFESEVDDIEAALKSSKSVDWVEENEVIHLSPLEVQPARRGRRNYGINDPGVEMLWGFDAMEIDKLYQLLPTIEAQKKATIAILDTGVDAKHEDLTDNFTSFNKKYDTDGQGHGTHCAGIAGAVSNNGVGVASFSTNNNFIQITSVRVLNGFGIGTQQGIIKGIIEAADKGADVISLSLGGRSNDSKQNAYKKAVKYANDAGAIVVVAAGNESSNATEIAPANTPGVIVVSAIDDVLNKAAFSNYITDLGMGVAAPGVQIYSTVPNNKYIAYNGTSMATPYVAGLIGLMKSIRPELTTADVYTILNDSGKATQQTELTGKLVQPAAVIQQISNIN